jgi:hypothetical protein
MNLAVHIKGPGCPKELGQSIAKALGITFDGIQEGVEEIPAKMQFTDPQTGSTTYGNILEEVRANLDNMRRKFVDHDYGSTRGER